MMISAVASIIISFIDQIHQFHLNLLNFDILTVTK